MAALATSAPAHRCVRQSLACYFALVCAFGLLSSLPLYYSRLPPSPPDVALDFIRAIANSYSKAGQSRKAHHKLETTVRCDGYCCHSLKVNNRSCYYENLYLEVTSAGNGVFWAFVIDRDDDGIGLLGGESLLGDPVSLVVSTHTRTYCQGPFPPDVVGMPPRFVPQPNLCTTENLTESNGMIAKSSGDPKKTSKQLGHDVLLFAGPRVKRFASESDLEAHVSMLTDDGIISQRQHVHTMFENHWNWGHHVLEAMYAAWMGTAKFGLENETICFVTTPGSVPHNGPDGKPLNPDLDPTSAFGGCPRIVWEELTAPPVGRWIHFEKIVLGASGSGMEHRNEFYEASMYDSNADDVMYLPRRFRSRMYDSYSTQRPQERSSSGEHRARGDDGSIHLKALLLPNKREWGDLEAMFSAINGRLGSYQSSSSSDTRYQVTAQIFDWSKFNTMRSQLEVLRDVDIYVSSVGTALTLQYFLPDTSVLINVGHEDGFWEEHLVAANRHLLGIYPSTVKAIRSEDEIVDLVSQAVEKIASNFSIPVPRGSSLSKYGSVFSTFLRADEGKKVHILPQINYQYQLDYSSGSRSNGCYRVVGHLASAFYWACGNKYQGTRSNPRCHPITTINGEDYMTALRRENNLWCPNFSKLVTGTSSSAEVPQQQKNTGNLMTLSRKKKKKNNNKNTVAIAIKK